MTKLINGCQCFRSDDYREKSGCKRCRNDLDHEIDRLTEINKTMWQKVEDKIVIVHHCPTTFRFRKIEEVAL